MDPLKWALLALGLLIIAGLGAYALHLQRKVKAMEKRRQQQLEQLAAEADAKRVRINKSIQIIAAAVPEEQMTLTEAAMRLSVLLESLGVSEAEREEFSALFKLAEATAHIPILEEWKNLPLKKRLAYDRQREQLEQDYRDFIHQCAENLRGREF
ncbi:MAG: DUF2489 domain-containing protein [Cellvibrionaceae bacterium]|nr:DUF2489 domain-containing protein [Cellvibrionaceae bacterium]MCV6624890.1 DUF2489 domain-containing protein [Cellvibrionaceae bacterium]